MSLKNTLREAVPLSWKLRLKRLGIGMVRLPLRMGAGTVNFGERVLSSAETHGLDIQRTWDVRKHGGQVQTQEWGLTDFLFVMKSMSGASTALAPDRPVRTSIVIPVFNKAELTFQCLRSLMREVDLRNTEIIIVNNASTDNTREMLSYFDFVHLIDNQDNRGFVGASNQGAAAARGKYLIFLNNDTVVLPGWERGLVETAERDETVGAVGSLFLYPDGMVQEAGGIVWNTGHAFHYGWGGTIEDRRYSFAREVDYASATSLLVRKDVFDQVGGFDTRYFPAYYEDVDLCFGVRSLGYKVIYQPASPLLHFEGGTSGKDQRSGFKRFQFINQKKFADKWKEVLERDHLPESRKNRELAANRKQGPNVMVIDDRIPTPDRDAGSGRMVFILKSLARNCRPVFIPLSKQEWPVEERMLWELGIETARIVDYKRLLKSRKFEAVILSRPHVAEAMLNAVKSVAPQAKIIFDMVDAHFIRFDRESQVSGDANLKREAERYRKLESDLARASDLIWCNSSEDKKAMEQIVPGKPIEVITTIHEVHERKLSFDERNHLLFVGNFRHRPNVDGVDYFLREVFPLVQKELPGIEFDIAGDNAPPEIEAQASEAVHVLGFVPKVEPLFQSHRVMIAPVRFGAGVKGKIGDALAYGLPVVTTSVGAEGMGFLNGSQAMIGDDPQTFAKAVVDLYRDAQLWERLSKNGQAHIAENFSPAVVDKTIVRSLEKQN